MNHGTNADTDTAVGTLSDQDFLRISQFIHRQIGIYLPVAKKTLLEGRLRKRMRSTNISSLSDYCNYLFTTKGITEEVSQMVNAVTTNKTDFFREDFHFKYLAEKALPELIKKQGNSAYRSVLAWSAACSTGEEPYTLAMVLHDLATRSFAFDFSVLATDISSQVLEKAELAVYEAEKIEPIPMEMRKKYLLKSKDPSKNVFRVVPELRQKVDFRRMNLVADRYNMPEGIHMIFCRNVLIYFDLPTQERVIRQLCHHLAPGGYLFMGHSETINNMDVPLTGMAPTVYRKVLDS
jgi:chemotaxis protein methyltransferase CheR